MLLLSNNTQIKQINSRDIRFVTDNQEDNPCHLFYSDNAATRTGNYISFPGMSKPDTVFIDSKTGTAVTFPGISGYWVSDIFRCGWTYGHQATYTAGGTYTLDRDHASTLGRMDKWRLKSESNTFTIQMGTVDSNGTVGAYKDILAFGSATIPITHNIGTVQAASPDFPENAGVTRSNTTTANSSTVMNTQQMAVYCQAFSWPATNSATTGVIGGGYQLTSRGSLWLLSWSNGGSMSAVYRTGDTSSGTNLLSSIQGLCNEWICRFIVNIADTSNLIQYSNYISKADYSNSKGYKSSASFSRNTASQTSSIVQSS